MDRTGLIEDVGVGRRSMLSEVVQLDADITFLTISSEPGGNRRERPDPHHDACLMHQSRFDFSGTCCRSMFANVFPPQAHTYQQTEIP